MDMRDIARLAGVSSATVSRVINGSGLVRPETAERVQQIISEKRFVPNGSATTLKYGRSSTYGLIIPDITNPFFPEFIHSFESLLADKNQDMLIATTESRAAKLKKTIHRMLVRQVEGIALLASEIDTEPIESLMHNRVPLVTLDRRLTGLGLSDVSVQSLSGMKTAVEHLINLRHRRIAYIGGHTGPTISDHRLRSFTKAMESAGLPVDERLLQAGNYRVTGGETAMSALLELDTKVRPTAIMCANDLTAIGALRIIHRRGLSVPGDFSVVGFDDIEISDIIFPPLTTLRLPREQIARTFVSALEAFDPDPHIPGKQYKVETTLIVRESTGRSRKQK